MEYLFILKKIKLQQRVNNEQRRLEQMEKLIPQIEGKSKMPDYQVVIKNLSPMKIASIRSTVPT
jgi:hypothetical protein